MTWPIEARRSAARDMCLRAFNSFLSGTGVLSNMWTLFVYLLLLMNEAER